MIKEITFESIQKEINEITQQKEQIKSKLKSFEAIQKEIREKKALLKQQRKTQAQIDRKLIREEKNKIIQELKEQRRREKQQRKLFRTCECGEINPDKFYKSTKTVRCIACMAAYYQANKEKRDAYTNAYLKKHPEKKTYNIMKNDPAYKEKIKNSQLKYRDKNKDILKEKRKQYYLRTKEQRKQYYEEYREKNREKIKAYCKQYYRKKKNAIILEQ